VRMKKTMSRLEVRMAGVRDHGVAAIRSVRHR
jgi:hypothetical protein